MIQLERKRKWNFKLSLAYKLQKFIPLTLEEKLKLFLDLNSIFGRLAHEQFNRTSLKIEVDPAQDFLATKIQKDFSVLDIGCRHEFVMERILHRIQNIVGIDYNVGSAALVKEKFKETKL